MSPQANLRYMLEDEYTKRDHRSELSYERPDPLLVARRYRDEWSALICALFAYGRAEGIVRFLDSLDFSLLDRDEEEIKAGLSGKYYRFQTTADIQALFLALARMKASGESLNDLFLTAYRPDHRVIDGIATLIRAIRNKVKHNSRGFDFLLGASPVNSSPYKRWNMYLRWMVRKDHLDMGLWRGVDKKDLIIPLDTHLFRVSRKLGLLHRKTCDIKAAEALTSALARFSPDDPVKYDFAIYRLGQQASKKQVETN